MTVPEMGKLMFAIIYMVWIFSAFAGCYFAINLAGYYRIWYIILFVEFRFLERVAMTRKEKSDLLVNKVYDFIVSFVKEKNRSPLVVDISQGTGLYYTTVNSKIVELKKRGLVVKGGKYDLIRTLPNESIYNIPFAQKKVVYFSVNEESPIIGVLKKPLTPTEQKVYDFLVEHYAKNGEEPNFTTIKNSFGFRSRISSHKFIKQLADKNHIVRGRNNCLIKEIL